MQVYNLIVNQIKLKARIAHTSKFLRGMRALSIVLCCSSSQKYYKTDNTEYRAALYCYVCMILLCINTLVSSLACHIPKLISSKATKQGCK